GDMGTSGTRLNTNAANIKANSGSGNAWLVTTGTTNMVASDIGSGALNMNANGDIGVTGDVKATGGITFRSTAATGNVALSANTNAGTNATTITATGTGTITQTATKVMNTGSLVLTSGSGNMGSSGTRLNSNAATLNFNSGSGS